MFHHFKTKLLPTTSTWYIISSYSRLFFKFIVSLRVIGSSRISSHYGEAASQEENPPQGGRGGARQDPQADGASFGTTAPQPPAHPVGQRLPPGDATPYRHQIEGKKTE